MLTALAWIAGYLLIALIMYWCQDEDDQEHLRKVPLLVRLTLLPVMLTSLWLTILVGLWPYLVRRRRRVPLRRVIVAINGLRERHHDLHHRVRRAEAEVASLEKRLEASRAAEREMAAHRARQILNDHWLTAVAAAREAMSKVFLEKNSEKLP